MNVKHLLSSGSSSGNCGWGCVVVTVLYSVDLFGFSALFAKTSTWRAAVLWAVVDAQSCVKPDSVSFSVILKMF